MKKIALAIPIILFVFYAVSAAGGEDQGGGEVANYPGMEIRKAGDVNVLVPKGSKLRRENDLFVIESAEEYVAPRLIEVNKKLKELEARIGKLEEEIGQLKSSIGIRAQ